MFRDLILANRSYRRFKESERVSMETLCALVDLARCTPSAANLQPLKYSLSCDPARNAEIFPCLAWAGYLKDWPGPEAGERPAAYITILGDTELAAKPAIDCGIAAQSILLGAVEKGLGGCMIGSIDRERLRAVLAIPARFDILLVIALGKPAEKVVLEPLPEGGGIQYWRDASGVHHVPKRALEEILIGKEEGGS
jgi:nitroreductase